MRQRIFTPPKIVANPPIYVQQDFPAVRYHPTEECRVVQNQDEADALESLGQGWRDRPYPPGAKRHGAGMPFPKKRAA